MASFCLRASKEATDENGQQKRTTLSKTEIKTFRFVILFKSIRGSLWMCVCVLPSPFARHSNQMPQSCSAFSLNWPKCEPNIGWIGSWRPQKWNDDSISDIAFLFAIFRGQHYERHHKSWCRQNIGTHTPTEKKSRTSARGKKTRRSITLA